MLLRLTSLLLNGIICINYLKGVMDMKTICIYKINNLINGKNYIGQTNHYEKRSKRHFSLLRKGEHHNQYLQKSFDKYGEDAFSIEILEVCSLDELDEREIFFIKKFDSSNKKKGYNLMSGGQGLRRFFTEDVKKRMSQAGKGRVFSEEHKRKISEAQKGKIISKEAIQKMKQTIKDNQKNVGESNYNAVLTEEDVSKVLDELYGNDSVKEISKKIGIKETFVYDIMYNRTFCHVRSEEREQFKDRTRKLQRMKEERAVQMYLEGFSQAVVTKEMSISRNTLRKLLQDAGIDTKIHKNQHSSTR